MENWFSQFPLSNGVERWWGIRVGGGVVLLLTVLPMGFSYSVATAQWTMELLLGAAHREARAVAWVDDAVLPGPTPAAVNADAAAFRARCHGVRAAWSEPKTNWEPRESFEAFGFVWELARDRYCLPAEWRARAAELLRAAVAVGSDTARALWRAIGVALWAAVGLQRRLHAVAQLLSWVSRTARLLIASPRGWQTVVTLSPAAGGDLMWVARELLDSEVYVGPPQALPVRVGVVVYTDASEAGWGVVIAHAGQWWAAYGEWDPAAAAETIFFLELRALLRGLAIAYDRLGLIGRDTLLRVDNLPGVQAAARGCSSTMLGNRLLRDIDDAAVRLGGVVAVEWVSTARQLADPFSRVPLGAAPPGCGAPGDLVALDRPPSDPEGLPPLPSAELYATGPSAKVVSIVPMVRRRADGLCEV